MGDRIEKGWCKRVEGNCSSIEYTEGEVGRKGERAR